MAGIRHASRAPSTYPTRHTRTIVDAVSGVVPSVTVPYRGGASRQGCRRGVLTPALLSRHKGKERVGGGGMTVKWVFVDPRFTKPRDRDLNRVGI